MMQLAGHQGAVLALAFTPDGRTLLSAGRDQTVRVWDLAAGRERALLSGHGGPVLCLSLHSNARILASGCADGVPRLWDLPSATLQDELPEQMSGITGLGWLPGRNTLVVASGARMLPHKGGELKALHIGQKLLPGLHRIDGNGIWSLAISAAGPTIAWGGGARHVHAWEITKQDPKVFRQPSSCAAVAISADGTRLASAADRSVRLWEVARGRELANLAAHKGLVNVLAFSPDNRTLASGGRDELVRFWSADDGSARRTYEWPAGAVYALAFSADGMLAAAAGDGGTIVVWDIDD